MITRGRPKKRTEDTDMEDKEATSIEEMEMIEEYAQGEQLERPTQPAPEAEVIVGDQPDKPIQKEDMSVQEMLRIIMEGNKQTNEKIDKNNEKMNEKWKPIMKK